MYGCFFHQESVFISHAGVVCLHAWLMRYGKCDQSQSCSTLWLLLKMFYCSEGVIK